MIAGPVVAVLVIAHRNVLVVAKEKGESASRFVSEAEVLPQGDH